MSAVTILAIAVAVVATALLGRRAVRAGGAGAALDRTAALAVPARSEPTGAPWWGRRRPDHRQRRRDVHDLPLALEDVARSVRSGTSLHVALAEAGAGGVGLVRSDLRAVVAEAERGIPLVAALDRWAARRPWPEVGLAVAALGIGVAAGAPADRAADSVAATLRERLAVSGELAAQATQARLSALVIALLPLGFTTWACATDGRIARFLLATPPGWACLAAGMALNAVGALWMARIVRSAS